MQYWSKNCKKTSFYTWKNLFFSEIWVHYRPTKSMNGHDKLTNSSYISSAEVKIEKNVILYLKKLFFQKFEVIRGHQSSWMAMISYKMHWICSKRLKIIHHVGFNLIKYCGLYGGQPGLKWTTLTIHLFEVPKAYLIQHWSKNWEKCPPIP